VALGEDPISIMHQVKVDQRWSPRRWSGGLTEMSATGCRHGGICAQGL